MKVNTTARGRRVTDTVSKMLPDIDSACIVLHFSEHGVEAHVHTAREDEWSVGERVVYSDDSFPTVTEALKNLDGLVKARVREMALSVGLAVTDPE